MNKFCKVSAEQYELSMHNMVEDGDIIPALYDSIKLPKRSTEKSAGYDFYAPFTFTLKPGESILIPTGIRVLLDDDKFLMCVPRSGLGFKFRLRLANTCGIIDADYAQAENEGHIMAKMVNEGDKNVTVEGGKAFMQGIILPYCKTIDDNAVEQRTGGFGSTDKG